ncbi:MULTISPECIES: long-chain fatty acid--CoA ligase [Halorussus]|uniref:long-chain fatty acid--CoA ligase n=1 Tax=Halorussus TaxID=1070314 RepID=UPI0018779DA8|nr:MULTISPECIES: long-chain fatty acid--CoA ligase [Halorussus]
MTIRPFLWRAANLFPGTEVVARTRDGVHRYAYADVDDRVRSLASGLAHLGVESGDRVGTFGWNHHRHFEAYYAAPLMGAQLHTINVQLSDDHVEYIVNDAGDDVLLVDPGDPFETVERLWDRFETVETVVVMGTADDLPDDTDLPAHAFEDLIADGSADFDWPDLAGDQPAGMCYTSGTTGKPKGVEYTQEMIYAHSLMVTTPAAIGIEESDVVLPVVPMFHVNSWEFPYAATMVGAKQVYPGPSPDAADLVDLVESEGVTLTAGVPTVWIDVLDYLEDHDADISSLERIVVGGSAAPEGVMRRYEDEHGVTIDHAWGMTETMSIGSVSRPKAGMADWDREARFAKRAKQGLLSPGLEMKIVDDDGEELPWDSAERSSADHSSGQGPREDGEAVGELYVRGPTVVTEYYNRPEANQEEFEGDWLKTGDIASIDEDGYIEVVDRAKDVVKSGGEWISTIELENALMAHEDVVEAAVIAVPHERWRERPLACAVVREGADLSAEDLLAFLDGEFPDWWLPDDVAFVEEVPRTATGKFDKKVLRDRFADPDLRFTPGE